MKTQRLWGGWKHFIMYKYAPIGGCWHRKAGDGPSRSREFYGIGLGSLLGFLLLALSKKQDSEGKIKWQSLTKS